MKSAVDKIGKQNTFTTFLITILILSALIGSVLTGTVPVANALGATIVGGISMPADVAVLDDNGLYFVVETGANLVRGFNSNNQLLWSYDANSPYIATGNGAVYVSNPDTQEITVLSSTTGAPLESHFVGLGGFVPRDIAVNQLGLIYVVGHITTPENSQVRIFYPDWSVYGILNFTLPTADHIDIDDTGKVFITYAGSTNQVHVFPNGVGPPILFNSAAPGSFNPRGIGVDGPYVYVADQANNRIQKFDTSGNFLGMWGSLGSDPGQFNNPIGVAADSGKIYVGEFSNNRIQIFQNAISATVSVTPNPVLPNYNLQITGQVNPASTYPLEFFVTDPNGNYMTLGTWTTDAYGAYDFWWYDAPPPVYGLWTLEVKDISDPYNAITLATTDFVVVAPGAGALVVSNVVVGDAPPSSDWSYALALYETTVEEFTLPSNGSATFAALDPGTYWVIQTRKFNYTTTSTTVDGTEAPNEVLGNAVFLTLDVTAETTTSAVFNNAAVPESAYAKSAGSGDSSPLPVYNMPSLRAIPIQVSWDPDIDQPVDGRYDLVKGRPIKIMVKLADLLANSNPPNPLGTPLASGDSVTVRVTSSNGFFTNNPLTPAAAARSGAQISTGENVVIFSMNPPSNTGSYTITCTIEHGGSIISTFNTFVKVRETNPLLLYYSHVYRAYPPDYGTEPAGTSGDAYDIMLTKSLEFVKAVYPVSQVNVVSNTTGFQGAAYTGGDEAMYLDCTKVWLEGMAHYNDNPIAIGVAIAPDLALGGAYKNYFKYNGAYQGKKVAVGVSFGPTVRGVVVSDGYYSAAAHEIAHVFNLYYGVPEQYMQYNPGAPANGFWVEQNQWRSGYDFMGLSTLRSTTSTWVSTDLTFEPIFRVAKTAPDPRIIFVNGMIYKDGTVKLPPEWYYLPYGTPDMVPTGDFAIRFTLADGSTVETSFAGQFFMNLDPGIEPGEDLPGDFTGFGTIPIDFAGFAFRAEYPTGTTKIELVDKRNGGDQVLATIPLENVVSALSAGFGGFLPPIKGDGSSFKKGTTVPVKFQLKTPGGTFITTAQPTLYLSLLGTGPEIPATSVPKSTADNLFRYDFDKNQYIFNLDTSSMQKGQVWQLRVYLGDGTQPKTVDIRIK